MLTVHHLEHSRSQRILWLLEELNVPYQLVVYVRDPKTMLAPATLRAIHPLGKSPVITDGVLTIAESGAIVEYLIETTRRHGAPKPLTRLPACRLLAARSDWRTGIGYIMRRGR